MQVELLSFKGQPKLKDLIVKRLKAHEKADNIIQGQGWENGKGCAVGCTLEKYEHSAYETELGLPEWLARLEDSIFEGMSNEDAKTFPLKLIKAIPIGVNLDKVKWRFCAFVLKENIERVLLLDINESLKNQVVNSIRSVLSVHENAIETDQWNESAAESARSAAESARSAARSTAESAAWSAWSAWSAAESAAWSAAWSAAESARSAAESARSAAWSAARSTTFKRYADELIRLLKESDDD